MRYMIVEVLLQIQGLDPETYYVLNNQHLGYLTFDHFSHVGGILVGDRKVSYKFKEVAVCDAPGLDETFLHNINCESPKRRMNEEDVKQMLTVYNFHRVKDRPWVVPRFKPHSSEQYFVHLVRGDKRQMFSRGFSA